MRDKLDMEYYHRRFREQQFEADQSSRVELQRKEKATKTKPAEPVPEQVVAPPAKLYSFQAENKNFVNRGSKGFH